MIECHQLSKRFPQGGDALSQVSFRLAAGEMAFLTGHSGAGKSTLLKIIAKLIEPSSGQLWLAGRNAAQFSRYEIPRWRRRLGILLQDPMLFSDKTVYENVAMALLLNEFASRDIPKRVRAALDKVGLLTKERCYPPMLSTGEQQRVAIARAVVHKPVLLLADEPTGNLDPELSHDIMRLFTLFNEVGTTVLIASHDVALLRTLPYRVMTLHQGKLSC